MPHNQKGLKMTRWIVRQTAAHTQCVFAPIEAADRAAAVLGLIVWYRGDHGGEYEHQVVGVESIDGDTVRVRCDHDGLARGRTVLTVTPA